MKVISIGTDRKLFEEGSAVRSRSVDYASKMEELHIVVFTLKKEGHVFKKINNLYLYPTNSLTQWLYVSDAKKLAKKVVQENHFIKGNSVISTQDPFQTGFVGAHLLKCFGFPLQVQIHTDFLDRHFSGFFNRIRQLLSRYVLPRASEIRVVSEVIADSLRKKLPLLKADIDVLPVFVDIEKIINTVPTRNIQTDFPQFKFIILMASRLTTEKRIDVAISSMKKVVAQFPHAGLVIFGDGPLRSSLERQTKHLKLSKHIVFAGWEKDLISCYKTANLFLLTSEYEGYGMTLIEAGASGCPIVTTRVGIAKTDIFKNDVNVSICKFCDEDNVSKNIIEIISDNQKRELFRHRMQETLRSVAISKSQYIEKYVNLLKNINDNAIMSQ